MLKKRDYVVKVGPRNKPILVELLGADLKLWSEVTITEQGAIAVGISTDVDCICDSCGKEYSIQGSRIKNRLHRKDDCGVCLSKQANEKMKDTVRTIEYRKKKSIERSAYLNSDRGKIDLEIQTNRLKQYVIDNHGEMVARAKVATTRSLKYGSDHHNYNPNKSAFKEYHRQVTRATNKHDLLILENSDKRGMAGESGAHHLDHMVSIKSGFERGIPAEVVGAKENLRFISWEENYSKRAESSMAVGELFARIEMNKYTNRPNWL